VRPSRFIFKIELRGRALSSAIGACSSPMGGFFGVNLGPEKKKEQQKKNKNKTEQPREGSKR